MNQKMAQHNYNVKPISLLQVRKEEAEALAAKEAAKEAAAKEAGVKDNLAVPRIMAEKGCTLEVAKEFFAIEQEQEKIAKEIKAIEQKYNVSDIKRKIAARAKGPDTDIEGSKKYYIYSLESDIAASQDFNDGFW